MLTDRIILPFVHFLYRTFWTFVSIFLYSICGKVVFEGVGNINENVENINDILENIYEGVINRFSADQSIGIISAFTYLCTSDKKRIG
ncbi:hypothetical protein DWU89_14330 [Parabacteroides acidifaciens]|uniref:Uncharacterized protein n=1 Tax=Parabacteroides acidifaciens TaxID=2290935 RepID=A0A3D8HBT6_9BACT|nr:hypothetical protein DWU89_14330 [Parabacteroides acidifaciens]RHO74877.1 hypothetical protein DW083_01750 [Parabacteroides sp. AF48-14]